jgi:tetratricopeptide (TPR) repeat protein
MKPFLLLLYLASFACAASARDLPDHGEPAALNKAEWVARATDFERRRDWSGLLAWSSNWTRAEPGSASAWFAAGRAYGKLQRYPEAIAAYRQDLNLEPGDVYALVNLGNAYQELRQYREALAAYRDAVRIDPGYVAGWHNFGLAFFALKGVAGVNQALRQLGAGDPALADAWRLLIIEYSLSRDPRVAEKAIAVLRGLSAEKRQRMFEILFARV